MNNPAPKQFLRDRLPWIVAILALLAMAATLYTSRNRAEPMTDDATARLTARLDAMEAAQRGPAARPVPGNAGMSPGIAMSGPGADGISRRVPQTAEQVAAERDKQLRELEAQFARDVADPVGGGKTEDTLEKTITGETMAGTGLKPEDVDIACKKNSCRIVSSFAKMGDAQDWSLFYITAAGGNVLSQTQMVFVPKADGSTEVRIYSNRAKG